MIRQLKFKATTDQSQHNWDTMSQSFDSRMWYPTLEGFSQGYAWGFHFLQGPLCFMYIWLYGTPTWSNDSYIKFPVPPLRLDIGAPGVGNDFTQFVGQLIDASTGEPVNDEYHEIIQDPDSPRLARILFRNAGSVTEGAISGTYIRN